MFRKLLLAIILGVSLVTGGFWALQAQDPAPPQNPRTDPPVASATVQTDLSGTYTGIFNCDALGLTGPTTLTITGNEFTTADGKRGRIVASTTGGYTAVAFSVTGTDPAAPAQVVSLRARRSGNRLTLTSVGGTQVRCSFVPGRGVARGRRDRGTTPATGTEVANPTASPSPTESPVPMQTPSPSPMPSPSPEPMPSPTPGESPSPIPSPTPGESPSPMPSPTPTGSPTPMPSPTPSGSPAPSPSPGEPMPSPSPSPSPSPRPQ